MHIIYMKMNKRLLQFVADMHISKFIWFDYREDMGI